MSLLNLIESYENQLKSISLNELVSQFSGVFLVDFVGVIPTDATYYINEKAVKYKTVETSKYGNKIVEKIHRAWALPGYLVESVSPAQLDIGIQLPALPNGSVSTVPKDQILITTIPKFWYPEVPGGDKLNNYELRFDVPFLDIKNRRQLFKVAQNNILDNGVVVIQLSSLPARDIQIGTINSNSEVGFL